MSDKTPREFVELDVLNLEAVVRQLLASGVVRTVYVSAVNVERLPERLKSRAVTEKGWRAFFWPRSASQLDFDPSLLDEFVSLLMSKAGGGSVLMWDASRSCVVEAYDWTVGCCPILVYGALRPVAREIGARGFAKTFEGIE